MELIWIDTLPELRSFLKWSRETTYHAISKNYSILNTSSHKTGCYPWRKSGCPCHIHSLDGTKNHPDMWLLVPQNFRDLHKLLIQTPSKKVLGALGNTKIPWICWWPLLVFSAELQNKITSSIQSQAHLTTTHPLAGPRTPFTASTRSVWSAKSSHASAQVAFNAQTSQWTSLRPPGATGGHRRAPARLTEEDTDTQERTLAVSVSPSSLEGEREVNGMDDGNPSMFW